MNRKSALLAAIAGLVIAPSGHAQQIAKPLSSLASSTAQGKITCHGISNIPMTLDVEQTIPMQIVAKLNCGDAVAILSDNEGYTLNVRTGDGRTGYVARVFIEVLKDIPAPAAPQPVVSAVAHNGVARWQPGAAGSEQFPGEDSAIESLTVNGVTVQVSLHDTGWKLRANVLVSNGNSQHINIDPTRFTLIESAPDVKQLAHEDPTKLVSAATHQILWTSASAYAPEGHWTQSAQSNSATVLTVGYKVPVPANNSKAMFSHLDEATNPKEAVLHEGKIEPDHKAEGAVWFERDKKAEHLLLRIPVDGVIFEFPLSFNHDK
jgi:hypothetical protein